MDRKLLDYLPPVLRDILEFQTINAANEPEIRLAWEALEQVLADQFLETAGPRGLAVWEKELKLLTKDTDSLKDRRLRIKAMWMMKRPYTLPWLRDWMDGLCGRGSHTESTKDYTLNLTLDGRNQKHLPAKLSEIQTMLTRACPANMEYSLDTELSGSMTACHALHGGQLIELSGGDAFRAGLARYEALTGGVVWEFRGYDVIPGSSGRHSGLSGGGLLEIHGRDAIPADGLRHSALTGGWMIELPDSDMKGDVTL